MNKNFLLAAVLSIAAIFGTVYIYNTFFHDKGADTAEVQTQQEQPEVLPAEEEPVAVPVEPLVLVPLDERIDEKTVVLENEVFRLTFTSLGGRLASAVLKEYRGEGSGGVDLVPDTDGSILPFQLRSGGFTGESLNVPFHYSLSASGREVQFYRDFQTTDGSIITCRKSFAILPDEYMIRTTVSIKSGTGSSLPGDGDGFLYSLEYGPNLGPALETSDRKSDYRYYHLSRDGEKRNLRPSDTGFHIMDEPVDWLGLEGKYFTVLSVPPDRDYTLAWDSRTDTGAEGRRSFFYTLNAGNTSAVEDTYYHYLGPKDRKILARYDREDKNGFGLGDMNFRRIIPGAPFMLALADGIKFLLDLLYALIPNYGVVIILFTLIIEILILPITRRSYNTTAKLRKIGPQVQEIRIKYGYDKGTMFTKLQELYAAEGVKGRLNMVPLLVHLPIFLLLYTLLATYIGFRMEPFIGGWIPDISRPDVIWDIYPLAVPLVGWTAFRGLPILMFITSILQSRFTQAPDQLGRSMIFMSFLLPILLLFVMYEMPSGVVLYWTVHNIANLGYQFYRIRKG